MFSVDCYWPSCKEFRRRVLNLVSRRLMERLQNHRRQVLRDTLNSWPLVHWLCRNKGAAESEVAIENALLTSLVIGYSETRTLRLARENDV